MLLLKGDLNGIVSLHECYPLTPTLLAMHGAVCTNFISGKRPTSGQTGNSANSEEKYKVIGK